jgi:hypothetical protein
MRRYGAHRRYPGPIHRPLFDLPRGHGGGALHPFYGTPMDEPPESWTFERTWWKRRKSQARSESEISSDHLASLDFP